MFGSSSNKFENFGKTRTQANSNMILVLWRKLQDKLTKTVYPARERVLRSKKKDAQGFSRKHAVLGEYAFPASSLVKMRDDTKESKWNSRYEGLFTIVRKTAAVPMYCSTSLVLSSAPFCLII